MMLTAQHFEDMVNQWRARSEYPRDYWLPRTVFAVTLLRKYLTSGASWLDVGCAAGQRCELLHE